MLKVNLIGRLGRDAGVYETSNGSKFVAFTIAVNTKNLGKDVTYWIDIRSFNQNHMRLAQYLKKGKLVQVGGDYNCVINTDKTGVARIANNVNADYISFLNLGNGVKNDEHASTTNDEPQVVQKADADEDAIVMNTPSTTSQVPVSVGAGVSATGETDDLPF